MFSKIKEMIQTLHSYWAYLTLLLLLVAVFNALFGWLSKNNYYKKDLRISLFALVVLYIQLLLGLISYFFSPIVKHMFEEGMGVAMKDSLIRFFSVEHPLMMLIAVVLVTIGFKKHTQKVGSAAMFKTLSIYYGIALLFVLSRIPWEIWING